MLGVFIIYMLKCLNQLVGWKLDAEIIKVDKCVQYKTQWQYNFAKKKISAEY